MQRELLIEREDGFIAIECKQSPRVDRSDFRHLRGLSELLDKPLLLAMVVSGDNDVRQWQHEGAPLWNVPAPLLLGSVLA